MARLPTSNWFHPVRYRRTRPFADVAIARWARDVGTGAVHLETLNEITETIFDHYNRRILTLPRDQRPRGSATSGINNEINALSMIGAFTAQGRNVFMPTPQLLSMLDSTDLGAVRLGDLALPFEALYVSFGDSFEESLPGPSNQIDGAYVLRVAGGGRINVVITCRLLGVEPWWPLTIEPTYFVGLEEDPDATLEELIARSVESGDLRLEAEQVYDPTAMLEDVYGVPVNYSGQRTENARADFMQSGLPTFQRALALVANTLCYLTAVEDRPVTRYPGDAPTELVQATMLQGQKKAAERERARRTLLDGGYVAVRVLGRGLAMDPAEGAPGTPTGREVRPHWRRGHWRRQPYGEGRRKARLIWIRPTVVRADRGTPEDGHLYLVAERESARQN